MKQNKYLTTSKKIANLGLCASVAIIFGYVESLFPFFAGIPGMKLGLANLAVLFVLDRFSWKEAALVSLVRILVIGFLFGNGSGILYSLAGAAVSLLAMTFLKKYLHFTNLGISTAGGVSHNLGQLAVAVFTTRTPELFYYYPPLLLLFGILTGLLMGFLTEEVLKRIPN